jgi:hypothetical protein
LIIENENADADFKVQFAGCVTETEIRVSDLLKLLRSQKDYTALGEAFRLVAAGETEKVSVTVFHRPRYRRGHIDVVP